MEVPDGVIEGAVGFTVAFVFKVVFGLIEKNKQISDEENHRIREEIKGLRQDIREDNERHRQHENALFEKSADSREKVAEMYAWIQSFKESP